MFHVFTSSRFAPARHTLCHISTWRCGITQTVTQQQQQAEQQTRQFAIEAARLAANTRCTNVVVLDVRGISPVTDYMVIATGTSPRQMKTVGDELEEFGQPIQYTAYSRADDEKSRGTVIDFVHAVIHIFDNESRGYY